MAKIAQKTARYIAEHQTLKQCLAKDVINYSKLARQISEELSIKNVGAVLAACRRYAASIRKRKEETGIDLLKKSRKSIKIENKEAHVTFTVSEKNLSKVLGVMK
jgi:hypothetical protein